MHVFTQTMPLTARILADGQPIRTGTLGAFINGDLHGMDGPSNGPPFGQFANQPQWQIMIYDDGGSAAISYKRAVHGAATSWDPALTAKF